jgi:hypothetical protein
MSGRMIRWEKTFGFQVGFTYTLLNIVEILDRFSSQVPFSFKEFSLPPHKNIVETSFTVRIQKIMEKMGVSAKDMKRYHFYTTTYGEPTMLGSSKQSIIVIPEYYLHPEDPRLQGKSENERIQIMMGEKRTLFTETEIDSKLAGLISHSRNDHQKRLSESLLATSVSLIPSYIGWKMTHRRVFYFLPLICYGGVFFYRSLQFSGECIQDLKKTEYLDQAISFTQTKINFNKWVDRKGWGLLRITSSGNDIT